MFVVAQGDNVLAFCRSTIIGAIIADRMRDLPGYEQTRVLHINEFNVFYPDWDSPFNVPILVDRGRIISFSHPFINLEIADFNSMHKENTPNETSFSNQNGILPITNDDDQPDSIGGSTEPRSQDDALRSMRRSRIRRRFNSGANE